MVTNTSGMPPINMNTSVTTSQNINQILAGLIPTISPAYSALSSMLSDAATYLYNACTGPGDMWSTYCNAMVTYLHNNMSGPDSLMWPIARLFGAASQYYIGSNVQQTSTSPMIMPPVAREILNDLLASNNKTVFTQDLIPTYTGFLLSALYGIGTAVMGQAFTYSGQSGGSSSGGSTSAIVGTLPEAIALRYSSLWDSSDSAPVTNTINSWLQGQTAPINQAAFAQGVTGLILNAFPTLSLETLEYLTVALLLINAPVATGPGATAGSTKVTYDGSYNPNTTSTIASLQARGVAQLCIVALKLAIVLTVPGDALEVLSIANIAAGSVQNSATAAANSATAAAGSATAAATSATAAAGSATASAGSATTASTQATAAAASATAAAASATNASALGWKDYATWGCTALAVVAAIVAGIAAWAK